MNHDDCFVLQCLTCNTIVGDSSGLSDSCAAPTLADTRTVHIVRKACSVRTDADGVTLRCGHCDCAVGRRHADGWTLLERALVRRVDLSTAPPAAERGLPSDSLEAVLRSQQRQLKLAMIDVSRKTAAVLDRVATVDAKAHAN